MPTTEPADPVETIQSPGEPVADRPIDHPLSLAIVSGMSPGTGGNGRNVRPHRVVSLDGVGLQFEGNMEWEQWRDLMRTLKAFSEQYHLMLADALAKGRERFPEEKVAAELAQLEFTAIDIEKATMIGTLDRQCRHPELGTEHYWIVARSEKLTELEKYGWLETARKEKLTGIELQRSIDAGKVMRQAGSLAFQSRNTGLVLIEGFVSMFTQWRRRNTDILSAPVEQRRRFLDEMKEVDETIRQVRESLGE